MPQTLWGENVPQRRRRKKHRSHSPQSPYSITGGNDCETIGHTVNVWDLAGCTTCLDCGVSIFCPGCISHHPQHSDAVPVLCERHERGKVSA